MSEQPTHHGYAVNVKDDELYGAELDEARDVLGEPQIDALYTGAQEDFWRMAQDVATEHGFTAVYSEGRMGGYAVPEPQPHTDDMYESEVEEWLTDKFRPFERAILNLMDMVREDFRESVRMAVEETRRAEHNNELASKVWRD